jgi:HEPN domain-containing protein
VTNTTLSQSYLVKARARLRILPVLAEQAAWSDVIREAQEIVELALKGMLRQIGVEPPKWHDVGGMVEQYRDRLPPSVASQASELARLSARLRKEREFSFYGDIDFIPTEQYTEADAARAIEDAHAAVQAASAVINPPREP